MLSVLSTYIPEIPPVSIDGIYGQQTRAAVLAVQRRFRLPETGNVDATTWDKIYDQYSGIENTTLRSEEQFPRPTSNNTAVAAVRTSAGMRRVNPNTQTQQAPYNRTTTLTQYPGNTLSIGSKDLVKQEVVR